MTGSKLPAVTVRNAHPAELDEVSRLLRDAYRQYAPQLPAWAWETYERDLMDVRSRLGKADLILAEVEGKLAGAVTLYIEGSGSEQEGWPQGWAGIRLLAVLPAFRGKGIGRLLMDECLRRCREKGIRTIGLHTSEMMDVAHRMYERMGFKRVPDYDFHPVPEVTVMAYRLDL